MIPTSIDGTDITGATIDGTDVQEITVDGQTVFTAGPTLPTTNLHANYDYSLEDGTMPIQDRSGNGFDLDVGGFSGVGTTINGVQAGRFVTDDRVSIDAADYTSISPPYTAYMVLELNTGSLRQSVMTLGQPQTFVEFRNDNDGWRSVTTGINFDTNDTDFTRQIIALRVESNTNTLMLENAIFSGNVPDDDSTAIAMGGLSGARFMDGAIGQMLVYDANHDFSSGIGADVLSFLSDKWGVTTV